MNATRRGSSSDAASQEYCAADGEPGLFDPDPHDQSAADADVDAPDEAVPSAPGRQRAGVAPDLADGQWVAWIERIVDRDERALTALYDATLSRVYGLVLHVVRRPALAEEVVEETYFQVWRQAVRFDAARGCALSWLLGMARSRAIDAVRREARFRHDSLDAAPDAEDEVPPADALLDAARGHADLQRALLQLNAQPRQLVSMAFFRGLSHEEIASETSLPLGTVKSQIRRALITLKQRLGESRLHAPAS